MSPLKPLDIMRNYTQELQPIGTSAKPKLKKLKNIKALIFDIYGTLFQSAAGDISLASKNGKVEREKIVRDCLDAVGFMINDDKTEMAELYLDTIRAEQDIKRDSGVAYPEVDILDVWEDLLGQLEAYELIKGRVTRKKLELLAIYYEVKMNPCYPMPGVLDVLEQALDKRLYLGVISNAQMYTPLLFEAFFEDDMEALGFEDMLCIWSYEHGMAKPGRELYEICAERLLALDDVRPNQVLYIGNDMRNDIWPASEIGFKTGLFAGDERSYRKRKGDKDVAHVKPDIVITELEQIAECL